MALTSGAKKTLITVTLIAIIGGGGFYFKKHKPSFAPKTPVVEQTTPVTAEPVDVSATPAAPIKEVAPKPVVYNAPKKHVVKVVEKHRVTHKVTTPKKHENAGTTSSEDAALKALAGSGTLP